MSASGSARPPLLPYWPALDGLRALAVVAVLCFHGGFTWAEGGYLGVSVFFTLSGFLITSLLLAERDATGTVHPRSFWSRRFRRLLPAALVAVSLAVLYAATIAEGAQQSLRGDVVATLAYVANWRFIFDAQSYGDLFTEPSPLLQFWSLAIEEQFYLVFPLVAMGLLAAARGRRHLLVGVLVGATSVSVALSLFAGFDQDRIYFGTDTRAAELLAGALLATWVSGRRLTPRVRDSCAAAGPVALAVIVIAMVTVPQSSTVLYQGGFALFAVASAVVVLAAVQSQGPVAAVLALRPAVQLGRISYGVYLYHWPVFLWLTPQRTGLDGAGAEAVALFAVRVGVTLALAAASFVLLEEPVRRGRMLVGHRALVAAPAAVAVVVGATLLTSLSPPRPLIDFAAAEQALAHANSRPTPAVRVTAGTDDDRPKPPAPTVAVFGGSEALMTSFGLLEWMDRTDLAVSVPGGNWQGCAGGRDRERGEPLTQEHPGDGAGGTSACDRWLDEWSDAIVRHDPDLAVVQIGPGEIDRWLAGDADGPILADPTHPTHPADPTHPASPTHPTDDERLLAVMVELTDVLSAQGATVVWLTIPPVGPGASGDEHHRADGTTDAARIQRLNDLMVAAAARRPGVAEIVDLAALVAGTGDDSRLRPDGVHFSDRTATEVSGRWLGPTLVELHRRRWIQQEVATREPDLPEPMRILVAGDSTAVLTGFGLKHLGDRTGVLEVAGVAELGCGILVPGTFEYQGGIGEMTPTCREHRERWPELVEQFDPHLAIVLTGPFDAADRVLPYDDTWRAPGDPVLDAALSDAFREASRELAAGGATVVWLTSPAVEVGRGLPTTPVGGWPVSDPARIARLNELIAELAHHDPSSAVVDYAEFFRQAPGGEMDATLRPDGVHLANDQAVVAAEWLFPQLAEVWTDTRAPHWRAETEVRWLADALDDLEAQVSRSGPWHADQLGPLQTHAQAVSHRRRGRATTHPTRNEETDRARPGP